MATIAFDVYGTLIDTDCVVSQLREWIGSQADVFSKTWRSKQLEYSFRRGLMRRYENFAVCTRQAPAIADLHVQRVGERVRHGEREDRGDRQADDLDDRARLQRVGALVVDRIRGHQQDRRVDDPVRIHADGADAEGEV